MKCPWQLCDKEAEFVVEDLIEGKARAACEEHVALLLMAGRVFTVTRFEEDGPEMRRKKHALVESQPG